ncbi:MAG TPA: ABC transporter permease [Syntrophobacteraceae bacterium]|nr:ABC transporter permease [Syntrophobacteraceae bacterium]
MWHRIFALVIKEFLALLKDKKSRTVVIVPPLVQLFIFGYAATFDLNEVGYAVYNEDAGPASRELLARFEGPPTFRLVGHLTHEEQIEPLIDSRKAVMLIHVDRHFTRDLLLKHPAKLQVILDGRNSNTAMVVSGYVHSILTEFNREWAEGHGFPPAPAALEVRHWFNPALQSRWFIVPGIIGLLTLVVTLLVTSLSVAREREAGTFDQLLVTPLRPVEILLGKTIPGILIGAFEGTLIILVAVLWFQIPLRGSLAALYLGLFLFLLSGVGMGLMISSIAVTQQQGLLGAFLVLVPSVVLSGFATPIANMPEFVQDLTHLIPLRYFLIILRGVFLEGADISILWPQYWPMAVIGMSGLAFASWLFRHRLY